MTVKQADRSFRVPHEPNDIFWILDLPAESPEPYFPDKEGRHCDQQ